MLVQKSLCVGSLLKDVEHLPNTGDGCNRNKWLCPSPWAPYPSKISTAVVEESQLLEWPRNLGIFMLDNVIASISPFSFGPKHCGLLSSDYAQQCRNALL